MSDHLVQGSLEWLEYRRTRFPASEAGAVMGVSKYFPKDPGELFDLKTQAREVFVNPAMRRGVELEPEARAMFEQLMEESFTPAVVEKGRYMASMDGISFDGRVGLEIKCPMSDESALFGVKSINDIKAVQPNYYWQLVHQFYVGRFMEIHFFVYHPDHQTSVRVNLDEVVGSFDSLCAAWEEFGEALDNNERPDGDDNDPEIVALVDAYRSMKETISDLEKELKACETQIKDYASKTSRRKIKCSGASITKATRKGNVQYNKIPELKGIDLEQYRAKPTTYWSIKL